MISKDDFLLLPYTPDLTEGGIAYACRSLPQSYDRQGGSAFDRMRRTVAGVVVELAFRRYLSQNNIPFGVIGSTPFTDPDRYDILLGSHRCEIISFLISYRSQISALHAEPGLALQAPAMVPLDHYAGDGHSSRDLYIFAFLTGLIATSPVDLHKAEDSRKSDYLIHIMPKNWQRPRSWIPLGPLVVKSESKQIVRLEIGGQDSDRVFQLSLMELSPNIRSRLDGAFYSLAYLHVDSNPKARLGIYSPTRLETYLIESTDWSNIWVYGLEIYIAGWIPCEEFRRRARIINMGSRVFQYTRTRTRNLAVSVSELRPLTELFKEVG